MNFIIKFHVKFLCHTVFDSSWHGYHGYHCCIGLSLPNIGSISLGSSLNSSLNSTLGGSYTDPLASYSPTIPPQQYNGSAAAAAAATFSPSGYMFSVPQLNQQIAQQLPQKEG